MNKNGELYRGQALLPRSPRKTLAGLFIIALLCAAVFFVASFLPAAWFFELAAIAVSSVLVNKVLKEGTFTVTYVLYEDKLEIYTRYGLIEKLTDEVSLAQAQFSDKAIVTGGRIIHFYPDKKLKKLLNI